MNPTELRMMWMSQYNPERITLEDAAATFFGHPSVGLSVMDDISSHQQTLDLNPMMSIVGGDFSGQAAAAAAALGVPQTALIAANTNNIYGLAQMGGLHQQLLQQSAAAVFQNYTEVINDDGTGGVSVVDDSADNCDDQQVYDQMDDDVYDESGGISDLAPKQEIINIDDFVMMTDSNSYDGTDFMTSSDKDLSQSSSGINISGVGGGSLIEVEHDLLVPLSDGLLHHKLLGTTHPIVTAASTSTASSSAVVGNLRTQRKTRKIEPVNRPGLVLKTPIAYKGNIDPSVIPIQKDGMAVCERCGAIGVKHTFYTKSRRFCSMACARGELYSLVVNNKMSEQQQQAVLAAANNENIENVVVLSDSDGQQQQEQSELQQQQQQQQNQSDIELALRVAHIKNSNYRFRITDQSKITQLNGYGEPLPIMNNNNNNNHQLQQQQQQQQQQQEHQQMTTDGNEDGNELSNGIDGTDFADDGLTGITTSTLIPPTQTPKALRMYRDVLPQEDLPQLPKFERLPTPCPQMEKIISIRRRLYDPTHSYDWTPRLSQADFYAAPVTSFPHAPGYEVWDNLGVNMKVEVENTDCDNIEIIQPGQTPTSFWVATILEISGYKALMRYEGFDESSHDFWVNLCNAEVHSVGWCATRGKPLIPPRTIENKYKDWKDFLVERLSGARTLPTSFYNKINDSMQSRFRLGLNLECVDKDRISQVRLATVTKIVGKRLFLRYFDSDDGFWCHEDSPIIHPVGWATTVGHNLAAPQDYLERMLAGREAMIEVHDDDATIELFKMNFTFDEYFLDGKTNGFVEGMKLEAVDPLNLSSICAATVMAVLKFGYMMIRIDSYQSDLSGSDWFCYHEKSPSIFPVGFCGSNNIPLTPPNGYEGQTFNWEQYLQEHNLVAASQHLFHRVVPDHGFEVGMSLECADLMDPRLVCVATVARIVGRLLKIHFDGWTEEYDQWLDCESPDFYPVGWCVLVSHKLEGPPTAAQTQAVKPASKPKIQKKRKKKNTNQVTATDRQTIAPPTTKNHSDNTNTVKPRTIALKTTPHLPKLSIKLELKPEHHNPAFYENNQLDDDDDDDDDYYDGESTSHRSDQSTPLSSNNFETASVPVATAAPIVVDTKSTQQQSIATIAATTNTVPAVKTTVKKTNSPAPPTVSRKATSYIGNSSVSNSKYIPRLAEFSINDTNNEAQQQHQHQQQQQQQQQQQNQQQPQQMDLMPETWNVYDVSQFLRVNDCTAHCDTFSRNKIDGKRLLQLTKDDIIPLLGMKVGPALKISDLIQQLKCKINPGKSRMHKSNKSTFL